METRKLLVVFSEAHVQIRMVFCFRRKGNKLAEIDRLKGLYRYSDKENNRTGAGIDYRRLVVTGVNEGGEQDWSRTEGGDADGNRQRMLLGWCRVVRCVES